MKSLALTALVGFLMTPLVATATVPLQTPIQGVLRDNAGVPVVEDIFEVTFALYDSPVAENPLWTETWPPEGSDCVTTPESCVHVQAGVFQLSLGTHTPLSPGLFSSDAPLWLGMTVETDPELPRRPLGSAPFAVHAGSAATVACTGCLEADMLSAAARAALQSEAVSAVEALQYVTADGALEAVATQGYVTAEGAIVAVSDAGFTKQTDLVVAEANLPPNGLNEISNGLLSNEFLDAFTNSVPVDIQDNFPPGVVSEITVADVGIAQGLSVSMDVNNSDLSTLTVILYDPENAVYVLHQDAPGDHLVTTYPAPDTTVDGDLTTWIGKNPQGIWRLEAIDVGFLNNAIDGAINSWSIQVETLSNKQVAVNGDLIVDGTVTGANGLDVDGDLNVTGQMDLGADLVIGGQIQADSGLEVQGGVQITGGDLDLSGGALVGGRIHVASEPTLPCDAANTGAIYLDADDLVLKICIDGSYQVIASGVCGDGAIQGAEECDDANALNGDGCNAACQEEPGFTCTGVPSSCTAPSCKVLRDANPALTDGDYLIDVDGGVPDNAFSTFCNMSSPHGAPDYKLITPDQFYHGDQYAKYGNTNGLNVFDYGCDACAAAKTKYTYFCPDEHWEVVHHQIRSHCNHASHTSDTVFASDNTSSGGVPGAEFYQYHDDCGDPNEFTILGVCRIKNTQSPDPGLGIWETHFRNVDWSN